MYIIMGSPLMLAISKADLGAELRAPCFLLKAEPEVPNSKRQVDVIIQRLWTPEIKLCEIAGRLTALFER